MKIVFCLTLLLIGVGLIYAEEPQASRLNSHYLEFGTGLNRNAVSESVSSNLSYVGTSSGLIFGCFSTTPRHEFMVRNTFLTGVLNPYQSPGGYDNAINSYYENLQSSLIFQVYQLEPQRFRVFAGLGGAVKLGFRINESGIGNSSLTYEAAFQGNVKLKAEKRMTIPPLFRKKGTGREVMLSFDVSTPLLAWVFTPSFSGVSKEALTKYGLSMELSSNYIGTPINYFNVETNASLTYFLKNRNALEISYVHDFISTHPEYYPSKTLNRMIAFKFLFNLK